MQPMRMRPMALLLVAALAACQSEETAPTGLPVSEPLASHTPARQYSQIERLANPLVSEVTVVKKRQHHRDQRGLLAAVQARAGGEHARRLAGEGAALPEERGAVEEMLERRCHVAEARRAAEREAGAFFEVGEFGVGWPRIGGLIF